MQFMEVLKHSAKIIVGEQQFDAEMKHHPFIPATVKRRTGKLLCQWYVEYSIHHPETGVRHRFRETGQANRIADLKLRKEALQKMADSINRKLEHGWTPWGNQNLDMVLPKYTTIEAALLQVVEHKGGYRKPTGQQDGKSRIAIFINWCKEKNLHNTRPDRILKAHIYAFLDYLVKTRGVGPKTYNNYLIELRSAFTILLKREVVERNPCTDITKLPTRGSKQHRAYSDTQMIMLLEWIRETKPALYRFCILVMHAVRPIEATRIRLADVNAKNRTITVWSDNAKNDSRRVVKIMDRYWADLEPLLNTGAPMHHYLITSKGVPGARRTVRDTWSKSFTQERKACGIAGKQYTMYGLKHTVACKLAASGATMGELMQFTGIKNLDALQAYLSKHIETPMRDFSDVVTF